MAERYLVTKTAIAEGVAVPENIKVKTERNAALAEDKKKARVEKKKERANQRNALRSRTMKYEKQYAAGIKNHIALRREAKAAGNFFVEPEAKLIFVTRIVGIIKLSPKPRKILQLFRLKQIHNGVFLKLNKPILNMLKCINPYVTFGYPTLKTTRELVYKRGFAKVNKQRIPLTDNQIIADSLGKHGLFGMEDLVNQLYTVGPKFKEVSNFLWPFKLSAPRGGYTCKRHGFGEMRAGDWGNREEEINEFLSRMN